MPYISLEGRKNNSECIHTQRQTGQTVTHIHPLLFFVSLSSQFTGQAHMGSSQNKGPPSRPQIESNLTGPPKKGTPILRKPPHGRQHESPVYEGSWVPETLHPKPPASASSENPSVKGQELTALYNPYVPKQPLNNPQNPCKGPSPVNPFCLCGLWSSPAGARVSLAWICLRKGEAGVPRFRLLGFRVWPKPNLRNFTPLPWGPRNP